MTPPYEDRGHGGAQEARDFTPRWMKVYTKMAGDFTPRWTSLPQDTLPILIAPPAWKSFWRLVSSKNYLFIAPVHIYLPKIVQSAKSRCTFLPSLPRPIRCRPPRRSCTRFED